MHLKLIPLKNKWNWRSQFGKSYRLHVLSISLNKWNKHAICFYPMRRMIKKNIAPSLWNKSDAFFSFVDTSCFNINQFGSIICNFIHARNTTMTHPLFFRYAAVCFFAKFLRTFPHSEYSVTQTTNVSYSCKIECSSFLVNCNGSDYNCNIYKILAFTEY